MPAGHQIFNIVFFAVTVSTVLQAATFEPLAARLGVTTEHRAIPAPLMETNAVRRLGAEVVQYAVRPDDAIVGMHVRDLDLPRDALLNLIVQNSTAVPPRGSTVIHAGDELHILVRQEAFGDFQQLLSPLAPRPDAAAGRSPRRRAQGDDLPHRPLARGGRRSESSELRQQGAGDPADPHPPRRAR
ncbi:MAG: hypothetical protein PGN13_14455, partial [Patulibacter minatonensis]